MYIKIKLNSLLFLGGFWYSREFSSSDAEASSGGGGRVNVPLLRDWSVATRAISDHFKG